MVSSASTNKCYLLICILLTLCHLCEWWLGVSDLSQHSALIKCITMGIIIQCCLLSESSLIHLFHLAHFFVTGICHPLSYCWRLQTSFLLRNCVYDLIMKNQCVMWGRCLLYFEWFQYFLCQEFLSKKQSLFYICFVNF